MSEAIKYYAYDDTSAVTEEERFALLLSAQTGDKDAVERALAINRGLVKKCLAQFIYKYGNIVDRDDLFQEGMIGLHKAIQTYDHEKSKFSTHAMYWIYHYMQRYIENNSRTVRVPSNTNLVFLRIVRYKNDYYKLNGAYPTDEEIIAACNVQPYEMKAYQQFGTEILSLNQPAVGPNDKEHVMPGSGCAGDRNLNELMSLNSDRSVSSPEDICIDNDMSSSMRKIFEKLSSMDKEIVLMRFGFAPYEEPLTLETIAKRLNTTSTTIRNHLTKITRFLAQDEDLRELA